MSTSTSSSTPSVQTAYTVTGMTCDHCAQAVTAEIGQLEGVHQVDVDLATGAVTVASDGPLDADAVSAAVEEAGYTVASADLP